MIYRIIGYFLLFFLVIALFLSFMGITHVEIGSSFITILNNTSRELNDFKIAIPNIPHIPQFATEWYHYFLILPLLIDFINQVINLLNFIVVILNYAIQLIQFIVILIKNLFVFRDLLVANA